MNHAVLVCYSWDDLKPDHDFCPNERSQPRFTLSPMVRREVLNRLLLRERGNKTGLTFP